MTLDLLHRYDLRPKRPEVIDSSMLRDFMDCPSMFYLRHVLGLRRKYASTEAKFAWGTAWHGIQEAYWKAKIAEDPEPVTRALIWINEHFPDSITETTDKHGRSKSRMIQQFFEYVEEKVPEIDSIYETIRLEQFFDVFNEELGLRWAGRVDAFRRKRANKRPVVWDYKTASKMGPTYWDALEHGFQFPGYVWANNQVSTESCDEIVADVMYTLKGSHQFHRRSFRYTPLELREWVNNVKQILARMHFLLDNHLYEPERWDKNWQECTRYGLCNFTNVHFTAPIGDSRLRILSDDYIEDRWDPLAHDNDDEEVAA